MEKKWRCTVCGYVHTGDNPPEKCPLCKAPASKFVEIKEDANEISWADGHTLGVAKGCDQEIWEGLQTHFAGECSEVGMYIAMSRQADREGYPEIAEAYRRIAYEEADHAARFAELLGEVVWDTKTNLEKRMHAEADACADKKRIATKAKQLNLHPRHRARDVQGRGASRPGLRGSVQEILRGEEVTDGRSLPYHPHGLIPGQGPVVIIQVRVFGIGHVGAQSRKCFYGELHPVAQYKILRRASVHHG